MLSAAAASAPLASILKAASAPPAKRATNAPVRWMAIESALPERIKTSRSSPLVSGVLLALTVLWSVPRSLQVAVFAQPGPMGWMPIQLTR